MGRSWNERAQYGNMIKHILLKQLCLFDKEKDGIKKIRISQNIGYLIQVQSGLIKDHETSKLETRLEELEKRVNIK